MIQRMLTQAKLVQGAAYWQGILDPLFVASGAVATANRLADLAKAGDWAEVLMLLESEKKTLAAYQWRPGGTKWFSVLHQAAWHGAPVKVVEKLLKHGGLRGLRDAKGRIPVDVAYERGHSHLFKLLHPPEPPLDPDLFSHLDQHLSALFYERGDMLFADMRELSNKGWPNLLRCPPSAVLPELPRQRAWFPITADGGFRITLHQGFLEVLSWNSVMKGSGEAHVITGGDVIPVDVGFI